MAKDLGGGARSLGVFLGATLQDLFRLWIPLTPSLIFRVLPLTIQAALNQTALLVPSSRHVFSPL